MKVTVELLAFGRPGETREVDVPEDRRNVSTEWLLDRVYQYGQNEVQPQKHPSASVGDVIELYGDHYIVRPAGFHKLTVTEMVDYLNLNQRDRQFSAICRPRD